MKLCITAVLGIATLACGNASTDADATVRSDSSGIEVVSNSSADRQLTWEFEPVVTLGGANEEAESFFDVPRTGVAFGPSGQIHVLDAGNRRVRVFSSSGAPVRSFGREGEGPGEFQFPASLAVDSSGTITVLDFGRRALIRFDSSGTYRDQSVAPPGVFGPVRADGEAHVFATRRRDSGTGGFHLRLYRATAQDTTELAQVPLPETHSVLYESCGVSISLPPVFADPPSWDARAGRAALSGAPEYMVRIFDQGTEVRHMRRPIEPRAATSEQAVRELGDGEKWAIGGRPCTVPPEEVVEQRGIAEMVPVIGRVAVAPDGSVWVQREVIGEDVGPVDVFDNAGEYVGTLPPATPWPLAFDAGDGILALETNELGVQSVIVYRIRRN